MIEFYLCVVESFVVCRLDVTIDVGSFWRFSHFVIRINYTVHIANVYCIKLKVERTLLEMAAVIEVGLLICPGNCGSLTSSILTALGFISGILGQETCERSLKRFFRKNDYPLKNLPCSRRTRSRRR